MLGACIYTALIGDYEPLGDPVPGLDTALPRICFTDDAQLTSDHWEVRYIKPAFPMDPIRSQRLIKICPHRYLPDFEQSIYVDCGITFKVRPERLVEQYAPCDLALVAHSFRATLLDEFIEVSRLGLDDQSRIFEQLNHYERSDPDLLAEKPLWGAVLIRNHADRRVQAFSETWLAHVLRYSRRDQLSLNWALAHSDIEATIIDVDNHASWFHDWAPGGRKRAHPLRDPRQGLMTPRARRREHELFASDEAGEPAGQGYLPALAVGGDSEMFANLGKVDWLGTDPSGRLATFARDYTVAAEVTSGREAGERWFAIADGGETKPALVLARPNRDLETSIFLRWKHEGQDRLGRILLELDGDGFARLKVDLNP